MQTPKKTMKLINGLPEKEYFRQVYLKNKEKKLAQSKVYREKNRDKYLLYLRKWTIENKELKRELDKKWAEKNREHKKCLRKQNYSKNREYYLQQVAVWQKENPGKVRARNMKRIAAKINRTPKWADLKAIEEFYKRCPPEYEVDHIIPMQGKNISGLHVLANLQYLTKSENCSKGNKYDIKGAISVEGDKDVSSKPE
jgi:hypothetical protein